MRNTAVYQKFVRKDFLKFFKLKPSARSWHIPILAGLAVGIPLMIGYYFDEVRVALTASLAGLTILYLPSQGNIFQIMTKMFICAFGMIVSYSFAVFLSFSDIAAVLGFGLLSTVVFYVCKYFNIKPPGSFFFIMIASMALGNKFTLDIVPAKIGLFTLGAINACLLALLYSLLFLPKNTKSKISTSFKINPYTNIFESIIIGFFMLLSVLIGKVFQLDYPYWIPISCLAVLQGVNQYHIWKRGLHRIIGTLIGLILVWLIFSFIQNLFWLCLCIIILQILVELFIARHYALTVIFLTPLGVLLAETGSKITSDPNHLVEMRLLEVLIGSALGVLGGWFLYNERMRYINRKYATQSKKVMKKSLNNK